MHLNHSTRDAVGIWLSMHFLSKIEALCFEFYKRKSLHFTVTFCFQKMSPRNKAPLLFPIDVKLALS